MNTFIKRSMKIALAVIFIGASVVPACAQRGKGFKNLPKALGKKPPLTGTAPVVKPVTPRVPPTLKGAAQIPTHAVPNTALNTVVEREVTAQALTAQMISSLDLAPYTLRKNGFIQVSVLLKLAVKGKLSLDQLTNYAILTRPQGLDVRGLQTLKNIDFSLICDKPIAKKELYARLQRVYDVSSFDYATSEEDIGNPHTQFDFDLQHIIATKTDFSKLITPNTPRFIPVDFKINVLKEVDQVKEFSDTYGQILSAVAIDKIDKFLFVERNGQLFINVNTLKKVSSYEEALLKLGGLIVPDITKLRNQQIMDALKNNQDKGVNSLEEVTTQTEVAPKTADPTTQRTAEEIKSLVENLERDNPLRQAVEGMLKTAEEDGYIAPAK